MQWVDFLIFFDTSNNCHHFCNRITVTHKFWHILCGRIVYKVFLVNTHYTLKIVRGKDIHRFEEEISWLPQAMAKMSRKLGKHYATISFRIFTEWLAGCTSFSCWTGDRWSCVEFCLDRERWRHGDARIPNFILYGNSKKVIIIDFGFVLYCPDDEKLAFQVPYDMNCSIIS